METPDELVCPAFLAAHQRLYDLHAGELGQHLEPCTLGDCSPDRTAHRNSRGAVDLHASRETLLTSIWECADRRLSDDFGRRILAYQSLPPSLCRARGDGRRVRSVRAGRLISS